MKHIGNLTINSVEKARQYTSITEVTGSLIVGAKFTAPSLTMVGGNCQVYRKFTAPALVNVAGYCENYAEFTAESLTTVGERCSIQALFTAPSLRAVGGLPLPTQEVADRNLRIIAPLALARRALNMSEVHTECDTRHCMAGWGCKVLPNGESLEAQYRWNPAGWHLLGKEAAMLFYSTNKKAKEFLTQYL